MAVPLSEIREGRRGLLSIDGRNLFSLRTHEYGDGKCPRAWINAILATEGIAEADGEVTLVTMPKVFGFGFNPVNFWLCRDRAGLLRAVLAEVTNTFGEKHYYLCSHSDKRPITSEAMIAANKNFHVSPFLETSGEYHFRFSVEEDRLAIVIDLHDSDGLLLRTSLTGPLTPATSQHLLYILLANPLMPVKAIALIHYQAVKLFLKRVRHINKPVPPSKMISTSHKL